jgi:cell division protein FtsW
MNIRTANTRRRPSVSGTEAAPRRHKPDYLLVLLATALLSVGFVVVYAISPSIAAARGVSEQYLISKQIIAILLGVMSFFAMSFVPVQWWRKMSKPLLVVAIVLTIGALLTPVNADYPAHRWVRFAGLSFQTAEYVKLALLIWAASFFAERAARAELTSHERTFKPTIMVIIAIGIVIAGLQSDLGSAGVMVAVIVLIAYLAGMPIKRFLPLGAAVAALIAVIVLASFVVPSLHYRVGRLSTFLHPASDCQNTGYQSCQALIAIGSGGMFGKGIGKSVEASGYLPEAANDSIFAIMAEKFGFFGITIIVGVYVALFSRLKRLIDRAPSMYVRLLIVGILAWFSTQAIINIGAMVGLLPLKGITLPFVSYGGTSLLFVTAALGVAFQVSRYTTYVNHLDDIKEETFDEPAMRQARPLIVRRRA